MKGWTIEKIKEGFEKFLKENGRLPTAIEIENLEYLPSSRAIQSRFGGLQRIRKEMGYKDIHLGKGVFRSNIALRIGTRGRNVELNLENRLRKKFGEVFVHTEKILDKSKKRIDFYVYSPDGNFGIDVFYPESKFSLKAGISIKLAKYSSLPVDLYIVVANEDFNQESIDSLKIKQIPPKIKIISLQTLYELINDKKSYPNPLEGY